MGTFLRRVTYPGGGRRGDDGRRYIGIPKPKRISTYPRSSWTLSSFRPPRFLEAHIFLSVYLCSSLVRLLADATRSIADVEDVIDVLPA